MNKRQFNIYKSLSKSFGIYIEDVLKKSLNEMIPPEISTSALANLLIKIFIENEMNKDSFLELMGKAWDELSSDEEK